MTAQACHYLVGQRFGRLQVEHFGDKHNSRTFWWCICDCHTRKLVSGHQLLSGKTRSCGCLHQERIAHSNKLRAKHGMWGSRLYSIWHGMLQRCHYPAHVRYADYGGRGIQVCVAWKDFHTFSLWALSHGYAEDLTIDRVDNVMGHEPGNCRWVTRSEQERNKWSASVGKKA